ncbi:MAG: S-layer homology domain-containing protein, partial [Clostridiales bacterium]|nr:S-layer homology domain-containing protein [Clostridiales bacterium]
IFILIVSTFTVPVSAAKKKFKDVTANKWYYSIVENLAGLGIINGYPDGTFKPDNKVERQHVCVMVMKGAGIKNSGKKANFPDVPKTSEFSSFIATMADKGIVNGFPDGTFKPKSPVTRGQAAVMIAKAFGLKSAMDIEDFRDTVGHYAANHIRILNSHGVINGYPDGAFKPNAPVTRAEISKMISFAMAASAGSTKHQPDPEVQEAENAVRIAEREKTRQAVRFCEMYIYDILDVPPSTLEKLQTRLDRVRDIIDPAGKEVRKRIELKQLWISSHDSAGGVKLYMNYTNKSPKTIKYLNFDVSFYNAVGDPINTWMVDRVEKCYHTGPTRTGEGLSGTNWYWGKYYDWDIYSVRLVGLSIEYMDGTVWTASKSDLESIRSWIGYYYY